MLHTPKGHLILVLTPSHVFLDPAWFRPGLWWGCRAVKGAGLRFDFLCPTECPKPSLSRALVPGAAMNMPQSLGNQPLPPEPPSLGASVEGPGATSPPEHCWPVRPTLRNELDTFSVHFYIFFGPSVALPPERPAVFALRLLPVLDSGGVLSLELQLNAVLRGAWGGCPMGNSKEKVSGCEGPYLLLEAYPGCFHPTLLDRFWSTYPEY